MKNTMHAEIEFWGPDADIDVFEQVEVEYGVDRESPPYIKTIEVVGPNGVCEEDGSADWDSVPNALIDWMPSGYDPVERMKALWKLVSKSVKDGAIIATYKFGGFTISFN